MNASETRKLRALAALHGVQTSYRDAFGRRRVAHPAALVAALQALGSGIRRERDFAPSLEARHCALWSRLCEPVTVAWEGCAGSIALRLPETRAGGILACEVQLEGGGSRRWRTRLADIPPAGGTRTGGRRYVMKRAPLPRRLPSGYHRLVIESGGRNFETLLIVAPPRAFQPAGEPAGAGKSWGVFLPLYALVSKQSWGCGDFSDLARLMRWTSARGGRILGTLPLLASFLDDHFEPSPYAPASRLFWNEFYIDVTRIPELRGNPGARRLIDSAAFRREIERLRAANLVDYRRGMALKRRVIEKLSRAFFSAGPPARRRAFERFRRARPALADYARFRAVNERRRTPWERWPQGLREGEIRSGDYSQPAFRYHLYAQWIAEEQLSRAAGAGKKRGAGLYLDLPLGASRRSFDVWRERSTFSLDANVGAPPDALFTGGQDWGFPPLHPERIREQGYRHFIATLRHHLAQADVLRIDHVMGLHRLFWIPRGIEAARGVYVRYEAEELYAILCLESKRSRTLIAGENLGTVPPEVNEAMDRHGVQRLHVLQYDVEGRGGRPGPVPRGAIASLNTHDMPPFASFHSGRDLDDREGMGLLSGAAAVKERERRRRILRTLTAFLRRGRRLTGGETSAQALGRACLAFLAASPARAVLVNLEDLWGEARLQNLPGTGRERPNWRRKAALSFETLTRSPQVAAALARIAALRRRKERER